MRSIFVHVFVPVRIEPINCAGWASCRLPSPFHVPHCSTLPPAHSLDDVLRVEVPKSLFPKIAAKLASGGVSRSKVLRQAYMLAGEWVGTGRAEGRGSGSRVDRGMVPFVHVPVVLWLPIH